MQTQPATSLTDLMYLVDIETNNHGNNQIKPFHVNPTTINETDQKNETDDGWM